MNALPTLAQRTNPQYVGKVECGGITAGSENTRKMSLATIEPTSQGYKLRIIDERGESILQLNNNLVVVEAGSIDDGKYGPWNLAGYSAFKDPVTINRNGSFSQWMMVSTRSTCIFEGMLTFLKGAERKLFGANTSSSLISPPAQRQTAQELKDFTSLPQVIRSYETSEYGTFCGKWTWNGKYFDASWNNGAKAKLMLERFNRNLVVLTREDDTGVSIGLTARYEGIPKGNRIQDGSVTGRWHWNTGRMQTRTWSWTANW